MNATIWHNPRCGTSRQVLAMLEDAGGDLTVVKYLRNPPTPDELKRVLGRACITAREALRRKESEAASLDQATDDEIVEAMMMHPVLIERPIVETDGGAVLARPAERVREIL